MSSPHPVVRMNREYTEISSALADFCRKLKDENIETLAIDFEAEFNLHVYGEKLCLIQLFDGKDFYLVDPFAVSDTEIVKFLSLKNLTRIFFGADSDRSLVFKQYGLKMSSIYDLQHLVEVLNLDHKGLDAVLFSELGIEVSKKKAFQRYNWTRRPIDEEAKQYALGDVAHLFELSRVLIDKIRSEDKIEQLIYRLVSVDNSYDKKTIPGIFKTPDYKRMRRAEKNRYEKVVEIREAHAKALNLPPNTVLTKRDIASIARNPESVKKLRFDRKIPAQVRSRIINEVLEGVTEV